MLRAACYREHRPYADSRTSGGHRCKSNLSIDGYDIENNMISITDTANHEARFAYDAPRRVTVVTFPSPAHRERSPSMRGCWTFADFAGFAVSAGLAGIRLLVLPLSAGATGLAFLLTRVFARFAFPFGTGNGAAASAG